jgi:hypothetical protein
MALQEGDLMLANHTLERLTALGLAGMAKALDDQQRQPDVAALMFEERLGLMIDREVTERENRRLVTRLKFASLRQAAVVEDIDLRTPTRHRSRLLCQARRWRLDRSQAEPAHYRSHWRGKKLDRLRARPQGVPR